MTTDDASGGDDDTGASGTVLDALVQRFPTALRGSLVVKYSVMFLLIVSLIAGIGGINYVQIQETVQDESKEDITIRSQLRAKLVGQWVDTMRARTGEISANARPSWEFLLVQKQTTHASIHSIHYVNETEGRIVTSTDLSLRNRSLDEMDAPWVGTLRSSPFETRRARYVWTVNRSYKRGNHTLVGFVSEGPSPGTVVVVNCRIGWLMDQFEGSSLTTAVYRNDGEPIFRDATFGDTHEPNTTAMFYAGASDPHVVDEGRNLAIYTGTSEIRWTTVTRVPKSVAFRASRAVSTNVLVILFVSIVSLTLVGLVLIRQTIAPIVELRRQTRNLAKGEFDTTIENDRIDEIGALYDEFERMRRSLHFRTRELEQTNERLENFASVVSHDLRNPLNVAIGRVHTLQKEVDHDAVDSIEDALGRMRSIIEDVLALAREGRAVDDPSAIELEDQVRACWDNVSTGEATIDVEVTGAILADDSRLQEIFENLFRNSVEHGREDVSITVGSLPDGFYVEDDGPGIPPADREAVLEAGFTTSEDGTGFGLNIVEEIASAHGWEVTITESADGGARFEFTGVERPSMKRDIPA